MPASRLDQVTASAPGDSESRAVGDVEAGYLAVLTELVTDRAVHPDSHFFDDLGANSLMMAHFCARVRKRDGLPAVSIRDVYAHPSVSRLVEVLAEVGAPAPAPVVLEPERVTGSSWAYARCGVLQALAVVLYAYAVTAVTVHGYAWVVAGSGLLDVYLRAATGGGAALVGLCLLPVVAKWVLVGRWTARRIPLWSLGYVRFWIVKSLLHASPMVFFVGSPIYSVYLRALGARVGPGVTILSRSVPVCTDLLTIGAGALVRKDCFFLGYRAVPGAVETGSITLGAGAVVGEKTVLDIDSEVGARSQLGHSSSLQSGQRVPDDEHWHGVPIERTDLDYDRVPARDLGRGRRTLFAVGGLLQTFLVTVPLVTAGGHLLATWIPDLGGLVDVEVGGSTSLSVLLRAAVVALVVTAVVVVLGLALLFTLPRLLGRWVRPGTVYPLYGVQFSMHRAVVAMTNRRFFFWLFGDSSYIVGYLRLLGYRLSDVEQTGSNFGTEVQHETPVQITVGRGTMVADGLSILNADYSSTSFRVEHVTIGAHSFIGNNIAYPAGARVGDDCLLATKVMVPLDGPVREGVGLLGSPPFEIPRTVERDSRFDHLRTGDELARRLRAKNRHNLRSMGLMLGARWVDVFLVSAAGFLLLGSSGGVVGELLLAAYLPASIALTTAWFVLVERLILRFGALEPQLCSIYDPYFWWHERLWKVPDIYLNLYNGTPVKALVWRLLGVRIGRRVFDDGCYLTERTLTTIGDDAVLNHGSKLQCHSQEDGTFKSDRTVVGAGATLGVGAFVHYGVTVGEGAVVSADAFLMKGEDVPVRARWGGNPATPTAAHAPLVETGRAAS